MRGMKLAPPRIGRPIEDGLPPPGLRRELSNKGKEGARGRETKQKQDKNRLKDSARPDAEPKPTISSVLDVMEYQKSSPESFVQRTHSSFCDHEHDSNALRLPDVSDSRGKVGPFSSSAPPLGRMETSSDKSSVVSHHLQIDC
jgi:hypothetical protein